ncbi:MAG: UDP-N-acetylmuramate dehydrogenase [Clostridia bacterium]|nr:UDP-N-acetylmuramate dehydrogenase [Clostridia bacterium]
MMALPASTDEVRQLCVFLREKGEAPLVIGNGTNLLVTDGALDRFVIKLGDKLSDIERRSDTSIYALCGVSLARLASQCAKWSLSGLEFAHGIPGTLGGAVCMNAGAYGGEMKDVLVSAMYLDGEAMLRNKLGFELGLGYRRSAFSDTDCVVLGAEIELSAGSEDEITAKMRELAEKRRSSQPLDMPSAGSTFKRPDGGYAAALIEQAGLKGFSVGGAMVSEKHAGFVVNLGDATFEDVLALIDKIQNTVYARTGITLEPEVKIIR